MSGIIWLVDQDEATTASVGSLFAELGYIVNTYRQAQEFLSEYSPEEYGCLITEISPSLATSIELLKTIQRRYWPVRAIVLTDQNEVETAIAAMKAGALDYFIKPGNPQRLLDAVNGALRYAEQDLRRYQKQQAFTKRYQALTPREREVMNAITGGLKNKQIADKLHLSQSTVELHRTKLMRKLGIRTLAELVKQSYQSL